MREQEREKNSTVKDGEMINAFPEAEAPEIGIREHWGTGRGKEEGGYIIFAKRAVSERSH